MSARRNLLIVLTLVAVCVVTTFGLWRQTRNRGAAADRAPQLVSLSLGEAVADAAPRVAGQAPRELPAPADPAVAVDTILDLRAQFGSVLNDSELAADANANATLFDTILRETAGLPVTDQPGNGDDEGAGRPRPAAVAEPTGAPRPLVAVPGSGEPPGANAELAEAMRETASLLAAEADAAQQLGAVARQQRLAGLALLLEAEAEMISAAD